MKFLIFFRHGYIPAPVLHTLFAQFFVLHEIIDIFYINFFLHGKLNFSYINFSRRNNILFYTDFFTRKMRRKSPNNHVEYVRPIFATIKHGVLNSTVNE